MTDDEIAYVLGLCATMLESGISIYTSTALLRWEQLAVDRYATSF